MCFFGNSGGSNATADSETEGKPFDFSKWFVKSYKDGEHYDGKFQSLFAPAPPPPEAQKAANYNQDMGIVDPNDPYAQLDANTRKPKEDTELADDKATRTDRFKRRQNKDDATTSERNQGSFMNFYRG